MLQSGQSGQSSSSFALSRHVKAQTAKDLGNTLTMMKDSLYVTPEDPSSKLCREAMAIIMKDMHLSAKNHMHIAMLIQSDISYAELMMGMIDASIDNNGEETNAYISITMRLQRTQTMVFSVSVSIILFVLPSVIL